MTYRTCLNCKVSFKNYDNSKICPVCKNKKSKIVKIKNPHKPEEMMI